MKKSSTTKIIFCTLALLIICLQNIYILYSQTNSEKKQIDSLRNLYVHSAFDTNKINIYLSLIRLYDKYDKYASMKMIDTALELSKKLDYDLGMAHSYRVYGFDYYYYGKFEEAVNCFYKAMTYYEKAGSNAGVGSMYNNLGGMYFDLQYYDLSIKFFRLAVENNLKAHRAVGAGIAYTNIAESFININMPDSALYYYNKSLNILRNNNEVIPIIAYANISSLYKEKQQFSTAKKYLDTALSLVKYEKNEYNICNVYMANAEYLMATDDIPQAYKSICKAEYYSLNLGANKLLTELFVDKADILIKMDKKDSAIICYKKALELQNNIYNESSALKVIKLSINNYIDRAKSEIESLSQKNDNKTKYVVLLIVGTFILFGILLFFVRLFIKNRKLSKILIDSNLVISNQNAEIINKNQDIKLRLNEIKQLNTELNKTNESKDTIISIIAHDIKNPLTGIYGLADLISNYKHEFNDADIISLSNSIKGSTSQLNVMLENLLLWARTLSNRNDVNIQKINLKDLINTSLEIYFNNAQQKSIAIIDNTDEVIVLADKNMLMTVIRNLISNAIKFSNSGSEILLFSRLTQDVIILSVVDKGIGISKEKIDELFDVSINKSTNGTNKEKGSGLGLVLCRDFIKLNNGEIWVESQVGKGTTFSFSIPLDKSKG
jgi:two-component system, sensor histidine kinase and response regulator